jgi:hypothetical protein
VKSFFHAALIACWWSLAAVTSAAEPTWTISGTRHSPEQPRSQEAVRITTLAAPGAKNVSLEYQLVDPGGYIELKDGAFRTNWAVLAMKSADGDGAVAKGGAVSAVLPAGLQVHRRLVRYRIRAEDSAGRIHMDPSGDEAAPNFAYFVYDGIPAWRGAIEPKSREAGGSAPVEFSAAVMRSISAYHLIGRKKSIEDATWTERAGGKVYKHTGTLVFEGRVYDHIRYRARGGTWRYAMGKNMWKFDFNKGQPLEARDDYGEFYPVKWSKLNLRACIDHADYGRRGNQGMFEAVGLRLFNLAGVEAPATHWVQLRIIDEVEESPRNQYAGDFWGLYLAIENEDGRFLKQHGLPDGNLYKMEFGDGTLQSHAAGAVTNKSDLKKFMSDYQSNPPEDWWRTNLDLPRYYSYRSIIECIHHYDVDEAQAKNYDYYLNPETLRWQVIPWDLDLTWADHMYGNGNEPFRNRVLRKPTFRLEYENRLREIRDLLYNTNQAWAVIDECAAIVSGPAGSSSLLDADRAKWDYHPVMAMGGKAGQGLFYQSASTRDFRGMVQMMKDYVRTRGDWIDSKLLRGDDQIPATPVVRYIGPEKFPANRLVFHASEFSANAGFGAIQWRLAEIAPGVRAAGKPSSPGKYEINPLWESGERTAYRAEMAVPTNVVMAGHAYRVRVRMRDSGGRWSHWSAPVEFMATK